MALCVVPTCPCYAAKGDDHCSGHRVALNRAAPSPPEVTVAEMIEIVKAEHRPRRPAPKQANLFEETP